MRVLVFLVPPNAPLILAAPVMRGSRGLRCIGRPKGLAGYKRLYAEVTDRTSPVKSHYDHRRGGPLFLTLEATTGSAAGGPGSLHPQRELWLRMQVPQRTQPSFETIAGSRMRVFDF